MKHIDPATGEEMTTGDWVSLKMQGVIRNWWVLIVINVYVLYCWTFRDPIWRHSMDDILNYLLSLWAVDVEMIVGMFFLRLTLRDHKGLFETRRDVAQIRKDIEEK